MKGIKDIVSDIVGLLPGPVGLYAQASKAIPEDTPSWYKPQLEERKFGARGILKGSTLGYVEPDPEAQSESLAGRAAEIAGDLGASLIPYTGALKGAKALGIASRIPQQAAVGAGLGLLTKPEPDESRIKNAVEGAVLFPLIDQAFLRLPKAIKALWKSGRPDITNIDQPAFLKTQFAVLDKLTKEGKIAKETLEDPEVMSKISARIGEKVREQMVGYISPEAAESSITGIVNKLPKDVSVGPLGPRISRVFEGKPLAAGEEIGAEDVLRSKYQATVESLERLAPGTGKPVTDAVFDESLLVASYEDLLRASDYHALSPALRRLIRSSIEDPSIQLPPALQGVRSRLKSLFEKVYSDASSVGTIESLPTGEKVATRYIENYHPRQVNDAFWKDFKTPEGRSKIIQSMVEKSKGNLQSQDAAALLDRFASQARKEGHLESARTLFELPDNYRVEDPLKEVVDYIEGAAKRVSQVKHFGPADEKILGLITQATENAPQRNKLATDLFVKTIRGGGSGTTLPEEKNIYTWLRNLQTLKLVAAPIRQPTQIASVLMNVAEGASPKRLAGTIKEVLQGQWTEIAHKLGAVDRNEFARIIDAKSSWVSKYLKWIGFNLMDEFPRKIAVAEGMKELVHVQKMLKVNPDQPTLIRWLTRRGIDPKALIEREPLTLDNAINDPMLLRSAWATNQKSNYLSNPAFLPPAFQDPFWKTILQFKQYPSQQGRELYNEAIAEAAKGNNKPLKVLGMATAAIGIPTVYIYAAITGKEPPADLQDMLTQAATFGSPGYGLPQTAESAAFGKGGLIQSLAGPTLSDASTIANAIARSVDRGEATPLASFLSSQVTRPIPFVGPRISRSLKEMFSANMKADTKAKKKLAKESK